jgi:hypothetical protein
VPATWDGRGEDGAPFMAGQPAIRSSPLLCVSKTGKLNACWFMRERKTQVDRSVGNEEVTVRRAIPYFWK